MMPIFCLRLRVVAGGGGGPARRAWAVLITQNDGSGSYCGMTLLEMRTSVGGTNVIDESFRVVAAFGTPAINSDNAIHKAFSSSLAEGYLSHHSDDTLVGWDFDAQGDGDKEIVEIVIYGSYNAPEASPVEFQLLSTPDDPTASPTWTVVQSFVTATGWTANEMRVFPV